MRDLDAACIFFRDGAGVEMGPGKEWRPIRHMDMHLANVFTEKNEDSMGSDGEPVFRKGTFPAEEFPRIILSDFDQPCFDLQGPGDDYQDNPQHYRNNGTSADLDNGASLSAPETYSNLTGEDRERRLDSTVDVWSIGQIAWNLILNVLGWRGAMHYQEPFLDGHGPDGERLTNGEACTDENLDEGLLQGTAPLEVSARYSNTLKIVVRLCLRYDQQGRIALDDLRGIIDASIADPPPTQAVSDLMMIIPDDLESMRRGHRRSAAGAGLDDESDGRRSKKARDSESEDPEET
ncbi:hypothetical protein T440DRAFT_558832 [Plenodomus tracheiphilus IPT5]|uniref:Protein kinase domain-containing protein n=1 Tax=Plenodomus tracheiphilus IPT5 TaxID=1408161 RepID=A0A6A7ASD6_9PLEO|nr:hypothetical protein T440DRAFT_558832 [Plenodomus tracheiphilus IPT5]